MEWMRVETHWTPFIVAGRLADYKQLHLNVKFTWLGRSKNVNFMTIFCAKILHKGDFRFNFRFFVLFYRSEILNWT